MAKPWKAPAASDHRRPPDTIHEICRRYYACAVALAQAMGLPLSETFLREHRESISCCFIEAGRAGVRLPAGVPLPPLVAPVAEGNGPAALQPKASNRAIAKAIGTSYETVRRDRGDTNVSAKGAGVGSDHGQARGGDTNVSARATAAASDAAPTLDPESPEADPAPAAEPEALPATWFERDAEEEAAHA
jgi:hypothetical protein